MKTLNATTAEGSSSSDLLGPKRRGIRLEDLDHCVGCAHSAGKIIGLLAMMEGDRRDAIAMLADALKNLGITGSEIEHEQNANYWTPTDEDPKWTEWNKRAQELEAEALRKWA